MVCHPNCREALLERFHDTSRLAATHRPPSFGLHATNAVATNRVTTRWKLRSCHFRWLGRGLWPYRLLRGFVCTSIAGRHTPRVASDLRGGSIFLGRDRVARGQGRVMRGANQARIRDDGAGVLWLFHLGFGGCLFRSGPDTCKMVL